MTAIREHILVVDDSPAARAVHRRCLETLGHVVTVADSGHEALERIQSDRFDLVLLDIGLPGLDGWDVLREIRARHAPSALPVIMATGRDDDEAIARALDEGANDYVTKPINPTVFAARIETQLRLKRFHDRNIELQGDLERRNTALESANSRMKRDLESAARTQRALLPGTALRIGNLAFDWIFQPCDELGGDILNVFRLGAGHAGFYVLDVSGHGVPAALLSVTLNRLLSPCPNQASVVERFDDDGHLVPVWPREVAADLNSRFHAALDGEQFFTLLYAVIDLRTYELRCTCAGHPGPILVRRGDTVDFTKPDLPIGIDAAATYSEQTIALATGDRLVLFSDGISEVRDANNEQFGTAGIAASLSASASLPLATSLEQVAAAAAKWSVRPINDDVSVLALECCAG